MRTSSGTVSLVAVLTCAVMMWFGYLNKARCAGPTFDAEGRTLRFEDIKDADVCYSDIQQLWIGRGINLHVFPFVDGGITSSGALTGGTVEYPVLSGVLMWIGAIGAHTDAEFLLQSALLLAPFGLITAWLLARMAGWAALMWSLTPPIVLYAFLNWDLPVVAVTVAAVAVLTIERWSLRTRGVVAAVLLGVGFCLKLYPGIFVLPLIAYVLTGGSSPDRRRDVPGALAVAGAAAATVAAINLPFAVLGYEGWRASFAFQQNREADGTSNSIWYWGLRPLMGGYQEYENTPQYNDLVAQLSPALVALSFALALWLGWRRYLRDGIYPWLGAGAAMLCGFMLFHKVHSPQYTLWLLPMLILLRVPWGLVAAYLLADLAIGIGIFRWFAATAGETDMALPLTLVHIGVWGRAVLLVVLFFVFLRVPPRTPWQPAERTGYARRPTTTGRAR
ncbi:glycosyltransferase 87 family protein [Rhodococcus rhodochrous]|uniref:glycosyltransferase 87 family protein n=1 Tax=Rhodococcus rhodochrous TaxID=1829 RepID=UPI001E4532B3|nr:glycosyltransferase 87 family protein [Rhodococcus rhodochrous]MCD2099708.1 glycosyltransferase 87 family protein [Rhodococcus rhodochrous]MCD2124160.1 glycosyltransferase 87 family protein [Rhodococcus rhodochrous]MCQ4136948.1 glycosyltransferase 87 family protein [Rhodococcus rhodochrous]MDJ0020900.1 glycosyltransferase 87 family protein [Rhodococcus rhodochrous]